MEYLSKRTINNDPDAISVVFCIRNEKFRLQAFLEFYRRLGVTQFFAIDNNSTDDTLEYLLEQADVHVFRTKQSYNKANAGRDWTSAIAKQHCLNRWVLTLDVDEFLVFPFSETVSLPTLTRYLDSQGYEGLFTLFLDFYGRHELSRAEYKEGDSPFDVCGFHDSASSYSCVETANFPYVMIKGGPRQRLFWDASDHRSGPAMRKIPLVKWQSGFEYLFSTHSCTNINLADVTGVLAHFKFLSHLKDFSAEEVKRNDRIANSSDWKKYANRLKEEDIVLFDESVSQKWESSNTLIETKLITCSKRYLDHVRSEQSLLQNLEAATASVDAIEYRRILYDGFIDLWPAVSRFNLPGSGGGLEQETRNGIEEQLADATRSRVWRASYPLRKLTVSAGFVDARILSETAFSNLRTDQKVQILYSTIWWDLLAPFRIVARILKKIGVVKQR